MSLKDDLIGIVNLEKINVIMHRDEYQRIQKKYAVDSRTLRFAYMIAKKDYTMLEQHICDGKSLGHIIESVCYGNNNKLKVSDDICKYLQKYKKINCEYLTAYTFCHNFDRKGEDINLYCKQ